MCGVLPAYGIRFYKRDKQFVACLKNFGCVKAVIYNHNVLCKINSAIYITTRDSSHFFQRKQAWVVRTCQPQIEQGDILYVLEKLLTDERA